MVNEEIYNLLAKHFAGETLPEEEKKIKIWLNEDPLHNDQYDELKILWNRTKMTETNWDVGSAWEKVRIKVAIKSVKVSKRNFMARISFIRAAAVFLLFVGGYFLFNRIGMFNENTNHQLIERVTAAGKKVNIVLSDGSKIILNGMGRIKYPAKFEGKTREVELEGEAYFEIAHNPDKPFMVHSANISTQVLGTKFNVHAFNNENDITVSLIEGKVKILDHENPNAQQAILLKPHQQFVYNKKDNIGGVNQFDLVKTIGWKDDILKFDDEPLSEVFVRLERAYGIKYELRAESFNNFRVTANFKNETSNTITKVLGKLTGLNVHVIRENNETKKVLFEEY